MNQDQLVALTLMTLLGLNVFQFIYWSRQIHKLIDKSMCKNLAEYTRLTEKKVEAKPQVNISEADAIKEEQDYLNEVNRIFS